jgi:hypothetical protein
MNKTLLFQDELDAYVAIHPDFVMKKHKNCVTNAEADLLATAYGRPKAPGGRTGYQFFCSEFHQKMNGKGNTTDNLTWMGQASAAWNKLSPERKAEYNTRMKTVCSSKRRTDEVRYYFSVIFANLSETAVTFNCFELNFSFFSTRFSFNELPEISWAVWLLYKFFSLNFLCLIVYRLFLCSEIHLDCVSCFRPGLSITMPVRPIWKTCLTSEKKKNKRF